MSAAAVRQSNQWFDDVDPDSGDEGAIPNMQTSKKEPQSEAKAPEGEIQVGKVLQTRREGQMKVTLISGFLGSGKTTLLTHILTNKDHKMKCAVIVNEISEFNVDALAVEGSQLVQNEEKVVEMSNGCVCCTLREDLLEQLSELHQKGFDATLIEASGISEPLQTAQTFFYPHETAYVPAEYDPSNPDSAKSFLMAYAPLDNCVTVVDASRLIEHMQAINGVTEDPKAADDQNIAKLMFDQLEFANVVILNKIDMILQANATALAKGSSSENNKKSEKPPTVQDLIKLIKQINPLCQVIPTTQSAVPLESIINTGNFTTEFVQNVAQDGWVKGLEEMQSHGIMAGVTPETEEYGVSSMSFTYFRPFHPQKIYDWMQKHFIVLEHEPKGCGQQQEKEEKVIKFETPLAEQERRDSQAALAKVTSQDRKEHYGEILRGKGFIWIGNPQRMPFSAEFAQAGNTANITLSYAWEEFPRANPEKPVQRGQKLIFIGQKLNKEKLEADLRDCLLTTQEFRVMKEVEKKILENLKKTGKVEIPPNVFPDPWKEWLVPGAQEGDENPLFVANDPKEWLNPVNALHNGCLVQRQMSASMQPWVNQARELFGKDEFISVSVRNVKDGLLDRLRQAAQLLCKRLGSMPKPLAAQIEADAADVGMVVHGLCGSESSDTMEVKLELIGANSCARWHQDFYVGRAIVSYSGKAGTVYTHDDNVNFQALESGAPNEAIIKDPAQIHQCNVGDILFIKGKLFPEGAKALVHRAADTPYDDKGELIERLVLKVDVPGH